MEKSTLMQLVGEAKYVMMIVPTQRIKGMNDTSRSRRWMNVNNPQLKDYIKKEAAEIHSESLLCYFETFSIHCKLKKFRVILKQAWKRGNNDIFIK